MITVAVNDRPIEAAAIVQNGRVLLPVRATFSALGAVIDYDPRGRIIVARSGDRTVRLVMGEPPMEIIGTQTFVPLRFVADSFGANIGYNASAKLVTISTLGQVDGAPKLSQFTPSPDATVSTAYPDITASLVDSSARPGQITLKIDGRDVTNLATFDGSTITYLPRTALPLGSHTVTFSGHTVSGDPFCAQWSFTTTSTPPNEENAPPQTYGYQFYANGPSLYQYGDWMHFTLLAPPGGSAYLQLCGLGYQYALWNGGNSSTYTADVPAPYGYWNPACQVTAMYTAWNGMQYAVPLPLLVGLYTLPQQPFIVLPLASPTPAARTIGLPPDKRRPEPASAATPHPAATAHPIRMQPVHVFQPMRPISVRRSPPPD
jgi:Copper amine oxidase N-terminal domain